MMVMGFSVTSLLNRKFILVIACVLLVTSMCLVGYFSFGISFSALLVSATAIFILLGLWLLLVKHRSVKMSDKIAAIIGRNKKDGDEAITALQDRLQQAIKKIRTSKLGQVAGKDALYSLPWYITIGNPAAGKSTAIINSGLKFPFGDGDGSVVKGIGGTRNCDWFFTTEGILLDTAGRYSVHEDDRQEWLGFLRLLRKHRPNAPVNGIIVAVSIGEVMGASPAAIIQLGKNLRQRVQELTEHLEVFAPVYVIFTKMDLVPGFNEFFSDLDWLERNRVWGATLPYEPDNQSSVLKLFLDRFDDLCSGLKSMCSVQLSRDGGGSKAVGILGFPSEFLALQPVLKALMTTLFEDNPFQFRPIFRGFYFTSALQHSEQSQPLGGRVANQFFLDKSALPHSGKSGAAHGHFIKDLFSKIIFPDQNLVKHYATRGRGRVRMASVLVGVALFGVLLAGWSLSYVNNSALLANIDADLVQIAKIQNSRTDLESRIDALSILQERLVQLEKFNTEHPITLGLGLYQGDKVSDRLRIEYFRGVKGLMLDPVSSSLEGFLKEVNANKNALQPQTANSFNKERIINRESSYQAANPNNVEDAYNALKTYLMLAEKGHTDTSHLSDQLTRFWRGWLDANRGNMSREKMIRSAGLILDYYVAHAKDERAPLIQANVVLVDETRNVLRKVVHGMPAAERVYAEIKARASTRFKPVSVAGLVGVDKSSWMSGSDVVSGAFTYVAWQEYVRDAIRSAAINAQKNTDWVLLSANSDDLTLEGSPEQIQKSLVEMYKRDYVATWQHFVQGIAISQFQSFDDATQAVNKLGDKEYSPISIVLNEVYRQTVWDRPGGSVQTGNHQEGFWNWLKNSVLNLNTSRLAVAAIPNSEAPGRISQEFSGVARMFELQSGDSSLFEKYIKQLGDLRASFNQMKNQGDYGAGALQILKNTVDGKNSAFCDSIRLIDEQMLNGLAESQRNVIRPILVRPLMQSFVSLLRPASEELNKVWSAQVYEPFSNQLAHKYPFDSKSNIEASPAEIAAIFGPTGAVAKYTEGALQSLVIRRGDSISVRSWGDQGIALEPVFLNGLPSWIGALNGASASPTMGATEAPQTRFMLRPVPSAGVSSISAEIDGQKLNYRNGVAQWASFVWPGNSPSPGAKISALTFEGKTIDVVNIPGRFGLEKMINQAKRTKLEDGVFRLTWESEGGAISFDVKIVSSAQVQATPTAQTQLHWAALPSSVVVLDSTKSKEENRPLGADVNKAPNVPSGGNGV